jgi:enoyl-CoA hydratase
VSASPVTFEMRDGIAYVCLNTPPHNTLNGACFEALHALWFGEIPRHGPEGVVVHGSGRHFSSGADLDELRRLVSGNHESCPTFLQRNIDTFLAIEQSAAPVAAAINGCCLGAGLELALACHCRIATTHAALGLPESTFGLVPGCGGSVRLPALVGRGPAMRMVLGGQNMLAPEALAMGLVDTVVDRRELLAAAEALVRRMARKRA